MSLLRSLIAYQDWLSTDMPLLTELLATAQTREDASPVRGEIFVGAAHFDNSHKLRQERHRVCQTIFGQCWQAPFPLPHSFVAGGGRRHSVETALFVLSSILRNAQ